MPIYEYRCQSCDHQLEKLQRIADPPLVDCPACECPELRKLVSAAGFRLKGGGWYETDFKKDGKRNLAGDKEASGESKQTDKPAGKSDGKAPDKPAGDSSAKTARSGASSTTEKAA